MAKKEKKIEPMWCVIYYDFGDRRHVEFFGSYDEACKRNDIVNGFMCPDYKLAKCLEEYFPPVFIDA